MPAFAKKMGAAVSADARSRLAQLRPYPALDSWRNPITRGFMRKLVNDEWYRALGEIDFEHRMHHQNFDGIRCTAYETGGAHSFEQLLIFIHGGGFVAGSPQVSASTILPICKLTGSDALGLDYTLVPEAYHPTQIDELIACYRGARRLEAYKKIVFVAEANGAAIALSAISKLKETSATALPDGVVLLSPCVDGAGASDTHFALENRDPLIRSMRGNYFRSLFKYYAPNQDVKDPSISPIYADFTGFPPLLIHCGSREVLLGDGARLNQTARTAGVQSEFQVFDGMYHRFHAHWSIPEAKTAHADIAAFIAKL